MAKINLKFDDGTSAVLEGSPEELARMVNLLRVNHHNPIAAQKKRHVSSSRGVNKSFVEKKSQENPTKIDLVEIVNVAKTCDLSEQIEHQILDRFSQVDRILLPLFILQEHFNNAHGLTTGDIAKITQELGIPIQQPNVAHTLSGTASKYVVGSTVRRKGSAVKYKLSRKGHKYLKEVISGRNND